MTRTWKWRQILHRPQGKKKQCNTGALMRKAGHSSLRQEQKAESPCPSCAVFNLESFFVVQDVPASLGRRKERSHNPPGMMEGTVDGDPTGSVDVLTGGAITADCGKYATRWAFYTFQAHAHAIRTPRTSSSNTLV